MGHAATQIPERFPCRILFSVSFHARPLTLLNSCWGRFCRHTLALGLPFVSKRAVSDVSTSAFHLHPNTPIRGVSYDFAIDFTLRLYTRGTKTRRLGGWQAGTFCEIDGCDDCCVGLRGSTHEQNIFCVCVCGVKSDQGSCEGASSPLPGAPSFRPFFSYCLVVVITCYCGIR